MIRFLKEAITLGAFFGANSGKVFIESDIADIVEAVFNGPMATIE